MRSKSTFALVPFADTHTPERLERRVARLPSPERWKGLPGLQGNSAQVAYYEQCGRELELKRAASTLADEKHVFVLGKQPVFSSTSALHHLIKL